MKTAVAWQDAAFHRAPPLDFGNVTLTLRLPGHRDKIELPLSTDTATTERLDPLPPARPLRLRWMQLTIAVRFICPVTCCTPAQTRTSRDERDALFFAAGRVGAGGARRGLNAILIPSCV